MATSSPLLDLPTMSDDLQRVEAALREAVRADDDYLTQVASHLINAGGKRGRPMFALAAAAFGTTGATPAPDAVVQGAVAVELVHLGSLYHDDVMDEASTRRTVESVNARWGNLQAILAGDFLLSRASEIAAHLGTEVAALLANTIGRLCEGQILELQHVYNVDRTEASYIAAIEGKTAALYATACRIGALVAGHPRDQVDALTEFGRLYGNAFQIVDDVLDLVATDAQLGKPAGHDLVEGVYTLPVIRLMATETEPHLRGMLGRPLTDAEMEHARDLVRGDGAVSSSLETATRYLDEATDLLRTALPSAVGDALCATSGHLLAHVTNAVDGA